MEAMKFANLTERKTFEKGDYHTTVVEHAVDDDTDLTNTIIYQGISSVANPSQAANRPCWAIKRTTVRPQTDGSENIEVEWALQDGKPTTKAYFFDRDNYDYGYLV